MALRDRIAGLRPRLPRERLRRAASATKNTVAALRFAVQRTKRNLSKLFALFPELFEIQSREEVDALMARVLKILNTDETVQRRVRMTNTLYLGMVKRYGIPQGNERYIIPPCLMACDFVLDVYSAGSITKEDLFKKLDEVSKIIQNARNEPWETKVAFMQRFYTEKKQFSAQDFEDYLKIWAEIVDAYKKAADEIDKVESL